MTHEMKVDAWACSKCDYVAAVRSNADRHVSLACQCAPVPKTLVVDRNTGACAERLRATLYVCDACDYWTPYKGNAARHSHPCRTLQINTNQPQTHILAHGSPDDRTAALEHLSKSTDWFHQDPGALVSGMMSYLRGPNAPPQLRNVRRGATAGTVQVFRGRRWSTRNVTNAFAYAEIHKLLQMCLEVAGPKCQRFTTVTRAGDDVEYSIVKCVDDLRVPDYKSRDRRRWKLNVPLHLKRDLGSMLRAARNSMNALSNDSV